ncbi:MAG TPA: uroporphyrinogen decarboxylase family protein [Armatimonadota bacterium]|jgi:uroporphyrinogen decarboxylase
MGLTMRERFFAQMGANPRVPVPNWEFGYWETTLAGWHGQGLTTDVNDASSAYAHFGIEGFHFAPGYYIPGGNLRLCPAFAPRFLGVQDGRELLVDEDGVTYMRFHEGQNTIPHYLDYPVKDRASWEADFKWRLAPDAPGRFPEVDWDAVRQRFADSGNPVCLYLDSYVGYLRNLMGFENFAMLAYDDPELFEEMVETLTQLKEAMLDRLAGKIAIDMVHHWEDICFNTGPIIAPALFREIVVPRMKRVNDRLREEFGCRYFSLDCDGNFLALIEGWLDAGINILMPCEVDAGMDIQQLQARYGERCGFHGGIQKKALLEGPDAIREELTRVLPAVTRGGYLPHLDHACPANVPLANYAYYLRMKREMLGCA